MKKTTIFSSALVALAMLASCQKEQPIETPATTTGVTEFTATIEPPTKTVINGNGKVTWKKGDEITVTAASKSAVYVAASDGESTTFTLKPGQTAVGAGPYTATYGDISNQKYSEAGANCPLTAPETSTTNLQFSSPYAVLKVTAMSSDGETVKTVVVKYGNNSSILDCGDGEALTSDGKVFYVAVRPSTEDAALSISFYTADKMAKKTRNSGVSLAAKDLLPVTLQSFTWKDVAKAFKAVYNTNDDVNTLTFYYDAVDYSGTNITVYQGNTDTETTKYLFDGSQTLGAKKWGYNGDSKNIKSVVIDASVKDYKDLPSTAYMFYAMQNATGISGAEHLDVSNVTDMSYMFCAYGQNSTELINVPDVSEWNTGNVKDMSNMFNAYGKQSKVLAEVPKVKDWNTEKVENMSNMFNSYGYGSTSFNDVPIVSDWDTGNVRNMSKMFSCYGHDSKVLKKVPDVRLWNTGEVKDMSSMFESYGYGYGDGSSELNAVPIVSGWNTGNVSNMSKMFSSYGHDSKVLKKVPDVSLWNTGEVKDMSSMFENYGYISSELNAVPIVSGWNTGNVTKMTSMFLSYGRNSTALATVPNVSNWDTGNVVEINTLFRWYCNTKSSENIDCNLDLSGWNLASVTSQPNIFKEFNPKTFNVTIPAKTGSADNTETKWYVNGSNLNLSVSPPTDKVFKLSVIPAGALKGVFSVSESKKVRFSKGNLWYGPKTTGASSTFNFETNQYDISSSWTSTHVSNFYWSQTDSKAYSETYSDTGTTTVLFTNEDETTPKDGFTVNGNAGVWRTLSRTEWQYLLANHTWKYLSVNGRYGIVIAPDGFSGTIADSYDVSTWWATAEAAGLVFLPSTGFRQDSFISEVSGGTISCIYWTSTAAPNNNNKGEPCAYRMFFQWNGSTLSHDFEHDGLRQWAVGIRLVTDCQ